MSCIIINMSIRKVGQDNETGSSSHIQELYRTTKTMKKWNNHVITFKMRTQPESVWVSTNKLTAHAVFSPQYAKTLNLHSHQTAAILARDGPETWKRPSLFHTTGSILTVTHQQKEMQTLFSAFRRKKQQMKWVWETLYVLLIIPTMQRTWPE